MGAQHRFLLGIQTASVADLSAWLSCLLVAYIALTTVYRLYFHPLAKISGPLAARVSGFYPTLSSIRGRRHLDQYECHQKYGSVVRWAPDYVIFNTVEAIQAIYGESRRNNVRKADFYNFFDEPGQKQSTITTLEKGSQGRKRRILSHAFSPQALQGSDDITATVVDDWCSLISTQTAADIWSDPLDMHQYCDWFAMDTAASLTFSKSFNLIKSSEYRFLPSWITSSFRLLNTVGHSPILPYWPMMKKLRLNYLLDYDGWSRRPKFVATVSKLMMERKTLEEEEEEVFRKDFYHWIRSARDSETKEPYTLEEVLTECAMLMNGGTGGPSTMLTGCFFYLVHNADILHKLVREIRSTFKMRSEIRAGVKLSSCQYLQGTLDEAVRLTPAHAGSLPRQAMKGGQWVQGVFLPEGTQMGIAAYAVHHNEEYFPEPFRFWPDRWIVNNEKGFAAEAIARARSALFSFSAGGNNCIGKPTAYQMLGVALGRVLWQFDIRLPPGDTTGCGGPNLGKGRERRDELQLEDMFSARAPAVMIQFRNRPLES